MDPGFELAFERDGRYVVRLEGAVDDAWGNRWSGSGTFEFLVARTLLLDTAVLPGTPFEVGDAASAEVQVAPPVPADVEVRFEIGGNVEVARGRANRFGRFRVDGVRWSNPGEYRVDVLATWLDGAGELWAGARTWGSVVAPRDAALVAHGSRGIDDQPEPRPIWFRRSTPTGSGHIQFPFSSGDVLWEIDRDAAIVQMTWADPGRLLAAVIGRMDGGTRARYETGSMPPVLLTKSGIDAHFAPETIDFWSYAYRSVQRPLVRVRELVGEESGIAGYYWRFNSAYGGQRGVGTHGDLPNDFKFQFGGLVVRGSAVGSPQYAIYGSLFVLVPGETDSDSRVFPPFQGNGGGPDGGPLFRLSGKDIDLFFHPTALRPGTIVHVGERLSVAGYSAPPLASKIEVLLTSPSGRQYAVRGQASSIGWFHDPAQDFTPGEAGVWTAKVRILFDGVTSAGLVTAPFPTGGVLGTPDGEFRFFVVDGASQPLAVDSMPPFVRPAEAPVTFRVRPAAGLRDVSLAYVTTMPGFLLEEGTTTSTRYTYDAQKLAMTFPNLDLFDPDSGEAGTDVITISLLLSGTDAAGVRRHYARQIVLAGEELWVPAQTARSRRRSVR
jgi:hypothetical protein